MQEHLLIRYLCWSLSPTVASIAQAFNLSVKSKKQFSIKRKVVLFIYALFLIMCSEFSPNPIFKPNREFHKVILMEITYHHPRLHPHNCPWTGPGNYRTKPTYFLISIFFVLNRW